MYSAYKEITELIKYKELLKNLISRDIRKRYKRSVLGFLWVMLDPLLMMIVLYLVFAGLFGRTVNNYPAYVISGITMWQLFAQGTKVSSKAFINNRSLISKIYMPKSIFPISVVGSSLVHFIFSLVPLFIIALISGVSIGYNILLIPVVVFLLFLFSLGISLALSTLAVFFHDVIYVYDVLMMAWMYLSATFYPVSILSPRFQLLISFNPLYHYITLFRACLYDSTIPLTVHFIFGITFALISFFTGWIIYEKNKDRIIFFL